MIKSHTTTPLLTPEHWNYLSIDQFALLVLEEKDDLSLLSPSLQDEKIVIPLIQKLIEYDANETTEMIKNILKQMTPNPATKVIHHFLQKEEICQKSSLRCVLIEALCIESMIRLFLKNTTQKDLTGETCTPVEWTESVYSFFKALDPFLLSEDKRKLLEKFEQLSNEDRVILSPLTQNKEISWLFLTYAFEAPYTEEFNPSELLRQLVRNSSKTGFIDHLSAIRKDEKSHIKQKAIQSKIENWYQTHRHLSQISPIPNYDLILDANLMLSPELPLLKPTASQANTSWKNWFSASSKAVHPVADSNAPILTRVHPKPHSKSSSRLWTSSAVLPDVPQEPKVHASESTSKLPSGF